MRIEITHNIGIDFFQFGFVHLKRGPLTLGDHLISNPLVMYGSEVSLANPSPSHICMLDFGDPFRKHHMVCRYRNKPQLPWSAISLPSGVFVICMLVGYIVGAAWSHYDNVKEDCRKMEELKNRQRQPMLLNLRCFGPQAPVQDNSSSTGQPTEPRDFFRDALSTSGIGHDTEDDNLADISPQQVNKLDILSLGLPRLTTELSDDDIRETVYEVLLASLFVRLHENLLCSVFDILEDGQLVEFFFLYSLHIIVSSL
ncbi:hypothetical protein ACJX0J_041368, partial [Zea mays]